MNRGPRWSERIAQRYELQLDPVLIDWFDSETWRRTGRHEFSRPLPAETLLEAAPDAIWPGLMPPDCLPLIGNGRGDWLCLRIDGGNRTSEVIHWYHGGGDWLPWGANLAEAIFFDAARQRLPGRRQSHALAAEPEPVGDPSDELLRWSLQHLPDELADLLGNRHRPPDPRQWLETGVAEVAVRCELVLDALDNGLRRAMTPALASQLGVAWEPDIVRWLFDTDQLAGEQRRHVQQQLPDCGDLQQDWSSAAEHAGAVCQRRDDLAWSWDIAGWAWERGGQLRSAVECYRRGALASSFADQSIRFRTHWFPPAAGKFSTWRLLQLSSADVEQGLATSDAPLGAYLACLERAAPRNLRRMASTFWREQATVAVESQHAEQAYRALYRAGWDLGTDNMAEYRDLLARLSETAAAAGQTARAAVAAAHHQIFVRRFG